MENKKWMIDINDAYEAVVDLSGQAETKSAYAAFWMAGREILKLTPVDAVEVVHGRWINQHWRNVCSECGYIVGQHSQSKYCPNCGAKMDGDNNG